MGQVFDSIATAQWTCPAAGVRADSEAANQKKWQFPLLMLFAMMVAESTARWK